MSESLYVGGLNILLLDTSEITEFTKVAESGDNVHRETDKAFELEYEFDHKKHWIPKSQARLGHDGALWVKGWYYQKELRG
jgi:hypothetical protein